MDRSQGSDSSVCLELDRHLPVEHLFTDNVGFEQLFYLIDRTQVQCDRSSKKFLSVSPRRIPNTHWPVTPHSLFRPQLLNATCSGTCHVTLTVLSSGIWDDM